GAPEPCPPTPGAVGVPASPPPPADPGGRGPAPGRTPAHAGPAARRGGRPRRGGAHLVHLVRARTRYRSVRGFPAARRQRAAPGRCRVLPSLPGRARTRAPGGKL